MTIFPSETWTKKEKLSKEFAPEREYDYFQTIEFNTLLKIALFLS